MICTVAEAARVLGVTPRTVRNRMKRGKIEKVERGACVRVRAPIPLASFNSSLRRFLNRVEVGS